MFLPKAVYEPLPYLYFALSIFIIVQQSHWVLALSALLFYLAGCVVLIKRSENRRKDTQRKTLNHFRLPVTLYEFLPFIYIACAVAVVVNTVTPVPQIVASAIFVVAVRNLVCRYVNRHRFPRPHHL